jgi:hypothetical protein
VHVADQRARLVDLYLVQHCPATTSETLWYDIKTPHEQVAPAFEHLVDVGATTVVSADAAPYFVAPWLSPTLTVIYTDLSSGFGGRPPLPRDGPRAGHRRQPRASPLDREVEVPTQQEELEAPNTSPGNGRLLTHLNGVPPPVLVPSGAICQCQPATTRQPTISTPYSTQDRSLSVTRWNDHSIYIRSRAGQPTVAAHWPLKTALAATSPSRKSPDCPETSTAADGAYTTP